MNSLRERLRQYPPAIAIPLEQIDEWLSRAGRVTKLHSKRGDLSICRSRLALAEERAGGKVVPELVQMRERIMELARQVEAMEAEQAHSLAETERLEALPLPEQCAALGIPLQTIRLDRSREGWHVDDSVYRRPERGAYALLAQQGFSGGWVEGQSVQMLMHAAVVDYALEHYPAHKRYGDDMLLRTQFYAIADQMHEHAEQLVETIRSAPREVISRRLEQLLTLALRGVIDPETSVTSLMALWDGLGSDAIAALAQPLVRDPWYFRIGWPDLTVVRDGEIKFIEVKTTDSLIMSQFNTFRELLMPLGCSISVIKLTPSPKQTRPK